MCHRFAHVPRPHACDLQIDKVVDTVEAVSSDLQDIKQVFANCYLYNREDTEEYQCAMRLEKYFDKEGRKLGLVEEDFEDENQPLSKKARRTL